MLLSAQSCSSIYFHITTSYHKYLPMYITVALYWLMTYIQASDWKETPSLTTNEKMRYFSNPINGCGYFFVPSWENRVYTSSHVSEQLCLCHYTIMEHNIWIYSRYPRLSSPRTWSEMLVFRAREGNTKRDIFMKVTRQILNKCVKPRPSIIVKN